MDPLSFEEFFSASRESSTPGAQLYLYRALHQLASQGAPGSAPVHLSYAGAKKLAPRLGLNKSERLVSLFNDMGLGKLDLEISPNRLNIVLTPGFSPDKVPPLEGGCELERGLIDGALELITGLSATTQETSCWTRGDKKCRFEAVLETGDGSPRYVPVGSAGVLPAATPRQSGGVSGQPPMRPELRSWYLDLAGRELARAKRYNRVLAVLYIDLDDLGEINQLHGRAAGDQVISAVAAALGKGCRTEDFIWHHGEDEFAVLLPETGPEGAKNVASRLAVQILSAAEFVDAAAKVSASIGYASYPKDADDVTGLLTSAKTALYLAKAKGKGTAAEADSAPQPRPQRASSRPDTDRRRLTRRTDLPQVTPSAQQRGAEPGGETAHPGKAELPAASVVVGSVSPMLMAGMKQVISGETEGSEGAMSVVGEITDPAHLLEAVADMRPDIILADLKMATTEDFALPKILKEKNLPCKLVVFANEVEPDVLRLAADFAADGVILQNTPADQAIAALQRIYQGKTSLPEEVLSSLSELEDNRRLLGDLSERELEVLKLVAEGKSNSQMSEELYITVNTVRFHLANVYQKLGVSNRTEAANYYLRQDLAPNGQTKLL